MIRRCLRILFFISGALALGYQTLWSKLLLDFIGISAYSYATVLASFMGGLAVGSWALGKKADTFSSPLKLYAYLELGIGLYAVLFPVLTQASAGHYAYWISFTSEQSGATFRLWIKILVSGILLLPPAVLMGGTYPALLRQTTRLQDEIGRRASEFYAVNCFGAVVGTLLMTFVLMPFLGMSACMMLLALGNLCIGLMALGVGKLSSLTTHSIPQTISSAEQSVPPFNLGRTRLIHALILLEGFLVFCYEIAWTRFFGIVLGSSTYSFSVMLAAFISGIAMGSSWLSRKQRGIRAPLAFLGWTQLCLGLLVLIPLPFYPYLPWTFEKFSELLSSSADAFYLYEFGKLLLCYGIMLLPTILIGMALPLAIQGVSPSLKNLGRDTGRLYAWNTTGNVFGAVFSGLLLLPMLGMEWLLRLTAAGNCLLGLAALVMFGGDRRSTIHSSRLRICIAAVMVVLIGQWVAGSWDTRWFTFMPARRANSKLSFAAAKQLLSHQTVILFRDDPAAHLMVVEFPDPEKERGLFVNGKADASSTSEDMTTQVLLGQIPLLLHPQSRDVLIIGLASGVTAGSVLTHPVERVDAVDLVRAMPEATRLFHSWNRDPLSDRRFHFIADDARSTIAFTRRQYDVIISEPSNPWMAGTGSLFSSDFYRIAQRALRPDGVYLQWLQAYEMSDHTFGAVIHSFRSTFPFVVAFQSAAGDLLLVGCRRPLKPDWKQMETRFQLGTVNHDLQRVHVRSLSALLYLQRFSANTVDYLAALSDEENTDDNRLLEYDAPRDLFQRLRPSWPERLDERLTASPSLFWSQYHRLYPDRMDPLGTLQLLAANRVGSPSVVLNYELAYYHMNGSSVSTMAAPAVLFPASFFLTSIPQAELAQRITFCLKHQQEKPAISVLDSAAPAILLQSAMSPSLASFWMDQSKEWVRLSVPASRFVEFTIELQMATGRTEMAAAELLQWVGSPSPPPSTWAVLRAGQLNQPAILSAVVDVYLRREPTPFLQRLRALTDARPRP